MTKFYRLVCWACLMTLFFCSAAVAQNLNVTGQVTSSDDGAPLPGVNIVEKGTSNGTISDAAGNFTISVPSNSVLVFSFVGYTTQEVAVENRTTINVLLNADVTALSEVVVIGYGEQKKEDLTGAVVALGSKDFNRGVISSPQDLIVGKMAGVAVTSSGGAPGSGSQIRIRGGSSMSASNDPLIVVDGFPLDNANISGSSNGLATVNPNDIASVTVLKDASATAIYGSRASNGVIIITTKKGAEGKPQVGYNGTVSVATPARYIDVMSGDEYRTLLTDLAAAGTVSGLDTDALSRLGGADTDWQKEIYRTALSHDHNVTLSGSAGSFPYRVSYGYTNQDGILKTTAFNRNSLNLNLTPSLLDDHLKVNLSVKASYEKRNFGNEGAVGAAVAFDPTQLVYNGNSRFGGYFTWTNLSDDLPSGDMNIDGNPINIGVANPVSLLEQTDNRSTVKRILGNVSLDYKLPFFPDLRAVLNLGLDKSSSSGHNNAQSNAGWTYRNGIGQLIDYTGETNSQLLDFYLNYVKTIGESKFDITGGYSYQSFERDGSNFARNGDESIYNDFEVTADGDTVARQYIPNPNVLISFFGRAYYSYKGRYMITATLRNDLSSRFSEDTRSGFFPAVAGAWTISEEGFMSGIPAISNLKLRAGWGVTGQQDIGNTYPYLPLYISSTPTAQYQFGNSFYNTLRPSAYDVNIKWEETSTLNFGVDFGLFNDRITASVEVYQRKTKDLINNIPIAAGSNFSNFLTTNVGDLENNGYEITLSGRPIATNDFTWNIGFNFTHNENKITKLTKTDDPNYAGVAVGRIAGGVGNFIQINKVGFPVNSFYVFEQIYDTNGMPIEGLYVDRTGEGGQVTSNNLNKYQYHSPAPTALMGINSSLTYKKLDFAFSGRISLGNYVYNNNFSERARYSTIYNQAGFFNNLPTAVNETNFNDPQYWSDFYVEDASFFKMDNIGLGYTFDQLASQKLKARVSFTVQNAFVITDYSGIDPEVASGIDNAIYPRPRTFLLGLNLTY